MLSTAILAVTFPAYEDPVAIGPPVLHPASGGRVCSVSLFLNAALSQYGQVDHAPFTPPTDCSQPSAVVLEISGSVAGVQFDRAGALWLGGVELLRTTTPEPDAAGIHWKLARDLTEYAPLFASPANATLQIPNLVDATYTGVLYINVSLTFYAPAPPLVEDDPPGCQDKVYGECGDGIVPGKRVECCGKLVCKPAQPGAPPVCLPSDGRAGGGRLPDAAAAVSGLDAATGAVRVAPAAEQTVVLALADPTGAASPWDFMGLAANQSKSASVVLPRRNVLAARLDVYASGHACEEFWYTNVPDAYTNETGACGGGAYRLLQLRVDGAAAQLVEWALHAVCESSAPSLPRWTIGTLSGRPTQLGARPLQLGGSPRPEQLASGRANDEDFWSSLAIARWRGYSFPSPSSTRAACARCSGAP